MKTTKTVPAKNKKKAIILTTLAVSAAGILGYFGWQYYKKKKEKKSELPADIMQPELTAELEKPNSNPRSTYHFPKTPVYTDEPAASQDEFPLRKGSKGEKVRALQQALIDKYGRKILPRYGADGGFGSEMLAALKKLQLPLSISESTYNVLVQGGSAIKTSIGKQLYNAAVKKDFVTALSLLKRISNKEDYRAASNQFKTFFLDGVRQTLVNGMLNSFTSDEQKQSIRFEFIRMGLQYDGNKWSLSGFDGRSIITVQPTTIWVNAKQGVEVGARTVLGNEVSRRLGYSLFENKGKYFLVHTAAIKYL